MPAKRRHRFISQLPCFHLSFRCSPLLVASRTQEEAGRDLKRQRKKRVDFPIKEALLLTFIQQRNHGFDHCQPQVLSWHQAQSQVKIKIFFLVLRVFFLFIIFFYVHRVFSCNGSDCRLVEHLYFHNKDPFRS